MQSELLKIAEELRETGKREDEARRVKSAQVLVAATGLLALQRKLGN